MDCEAFETALQKTGHPELRRPGVSTRLMVSLQYLKYVHNMSDEGVLAMWVENLYWQ
jgi:IS5 family transposase